jgi:hypothetical protein
VFPFAVYEDKLSIQHYLICANLGFSDMVILEDVENYKHGVQDKLHKVIFRKIAHMSAIAFKERILNICLEKRDRSREG